MANGNDVDVRDSGLDAHSVAKEESRPVDRIPERAVERSGERAAIAVSLDDLVRALRRHDEGPELVEISPVVRLARLERRAKDMEWALYALLGAVLFLWG